MHRTPRRPLQGSGACEVASCGQPPRRSRQAYRQTPLSQRQAIAALKKNSLHSAPRDETKYLLAPFPRPHLASTIHATVGERFRTWPAWRGPLDDVGQSGWQPRACMRLLHHGALFTAKWSRVRFVWARFWLPVRLWYAWRLTASVCCLRDWNAADAALICEDRDQPNVCNGRPSTSAKRN
jgi:hypothetical protein